MTKVLRARLAGGALLAAGMLGGGPAPAADGQVAADGASVAALFGQRAFVSDISLSPDGKRIVFISPGKGHSTVAVVEDLETGALKAAAAASGEPLQLISCGWSSNSRVACKEYGISSLGTLAVPYTRTVAFDPDGGHAVYLGRRTGPDALRSSQFDGDIIDWLAGDDGKVMMTRDYVPEETLGTRITNNTDGLAVDRVDTATGRGEMIEHPLKDASDYLTDGRGAVRIVALDNHDNNGNLTGITSYAYRLSGDRSWRPFSRVSEGAAAFTPLAVDGTLNAAYASKPLNGRNALYRVALDGSMKADLVSSNSAVDVDSVVTIGRHGRVIGASYVTDRRQVDYFDPEYRALAAALSRALPQTPLIEFLSASADEQRLIVFASSDSDPGRYYLFDKKTHHLDEILRARPGLASAKLASVKVISYPAADGTAIPAYLTLPPAGSGKGLPAIVMPHGGPAYRDEWGFDWLAQFFAQRGYAVLQPEFRGSSGYGDAWFAKNGFRSWQTAISDVCDGGRWLMTQGIAAPGKLAIVGWSYGGYAALQANVVDPDLFKAVVAIAPVTDLAMIKREAEGFTNVNLTAQYVGSGTVAAAGSPARHADRFKAPVLMFHGDRDLNVAVSESRAMDAALHRAGKESTLVVYPNLDHQLGDADVRAGMLAQADSFLRAAMKM